MNLESSQVTIGKNQQEVFNFLCDIKNFESLMPENISKFEVLDNDKFLFALKGMPEIVLQKKETFPYNKFVLGAAGGKFDFSLTGDIVELGDNKSDLKFSFKGDFNPMMAMMIKGPITKLIETLAINMPGAI